MFQSTLPARGATSERDMFLALDVVSIHAPRAGSDDAGVPVQLDSTGFNPRSPRGERPPDSAVVRVIRVSIHAPRAGSDTRMLRRPSLEECFNPRSPRGERPSGWSVSTLRPEVSIHAPRAGSDSQYGGSVQGDHVSIHAPRAGSDRRHRHGVRIVRVSIHAPRAGSDPGPVNESAGFLVSIHAPRAGSDAAVIWEATCRSCFNPRSPRGERRHGRAAFSASNRFQSTLPARGATPPANVCVPSKVFQSTLPARGATRHSQSSRGRERVSIHAPRAGSDDVNSWRKDFLKFQSTLPARGATGDRLCAGHLVCVSIHAPRAGSDQIGAWVSHASESFQSTLPARGATRATSGSIISARFNPRSPRGERPNPRRRACMRVRFNPRSPRGERQVSSLLDARPASFNPRSPRGERRTGGANLGAFGVSIHAPRAGSDFWPIPDAAYQIVSIHAPRAGSDRPFSQALPSLLRFNPRSPRGERRAALAGIRRVRGVSIHAPRAGSDVTLEL